jgi:hypothetical protein
MATSEASGIWAQNVEIFRVHPFTKAGGGGRYEAHLLRSRTAPQPPVTEQFKNQQRNIKCIRYASGT